jgi:hypothetical protein
MKKIILSILFVLGAALTSNEMYAAKLYFQTRAHGKDCDKDRGLCIMIEIEIKEILDLIPPKAWSAEGQCDGRSLGLHTTAIGTPWGGTDFVVDGDIKLSSEVSSALGYHSVTIKAGTYRIDFSNNKLGDVTLNVVTN